MSALIDRHRNWLIPLLLLVVAFGVRLIYLNQIQSIPTFESPVMDEQYHLHLARQINSPSGLEGEPYYRAPLYPYFIATLYKIFKGSLYWPRLVQIVLGSFLPLLVLLLGLKLFDRRVAWWSAVVAVFYPTFIYYDAGLLITSLMVLLTTLLAWQLLRCQQTFRWTDFIVAGILLGLAGLARPNILLLGPVLLLWLWLVIKPVIGTRKALLRYMVVGLVSLVVILPVTVRNYTTSGEFVFIAWQGGFNFFLGNNRQATGWSATVPGIEQSWEGGYRQAIAIAEQSASRPLKRSEVSDYWYGRAWDEIRQSPVSFLTLQLKKMRLLINGYEIPNNQDIYLARQFAPIIRPLMFTGPIYFPYGILAPLAIIGLVLSLANWRKFLPVYLVVASYLASLLLFFVCARFRQPVIPLMILFAVYAVTRLVGFIRKLDGKNAILFVAVLVLLIVESNHDMLGLNPARTMAENHMLLGNSLLQKQKNQEAEEQFRLARDADPDFAPAYNNLGMFAANRRQYVQAVGYFQKALQLEPTAVETYVNLATSYFESGRLLEAIKTLERVRQLHPLNDFVHLKLATFYFQAGRIADARRATERSLSINPQNSLAHQVYQQILQAQAADTTSQ